MTTDYQEQLGQRLRAIRNQQGLTLSQVEERSDGEWKAVVVGSYERGDRAISINKLSRLAQFYGVPVRDLLPEEGPPSPRETDRTRAVLDLTRLPEPNDDPGPLPALSRFAQRIQVERGDYNGTVLTIREDDIRALALAFDLNPDGLIAYLRERQALHQAA